MKKHIVLILVVILLASCTAHKAPNPITGPESMGNTGRIKRIIIDTTIGDMRINVAETYNYDSMGRFVNVETSAFGYTSTDKTYSYYSSGLLNRISGTDGSYQYYEYDSFGRLSKRSVFDASGTPTNVKEFAYNPDGTIYTVDEWQNQVKSSHRVFLRDVQGFVASEQIYTGTGSFRGVMNYTRNDTLKTINLEMVIGTAQQMFIELRYDSSGFYSGSYIANVAAAITQTAELQNGPFDPAGMKGYYYSDKDIYGVFWPDISAW